MKLHFATKQNPNYTLMVAICGAKSRIGGQHPCLKLSNCQLKTHYTRKIIDSFN